MHRWSGAILGWLIALVLGWAGTPQVQARAAILMDAETGTGAVRQKCAQAPPARQYHEGDDGNPRVGAV
jgi:hypothetical protein